MPLISYSEKQSYLADKARSIEMWRQLNLPDLNMFSSSALESTRALNISSQSNGECAGTQRPETNSRTSTLEVSSNLPVSVKQISDERATISAPFANSISDSSNNINTPQPTSRRRGSNPLQIANEENSAGLPQAVPKYTQKVGDKQSFPRAERKDYHRYSMALLTMRLNISTKVLRYPTF